MSRMQEDIQYAGSDTRPPMLDRTDFESWQQRIRLYCLGKDNGENIMKSIKEGPFQMGTVSDVITGGTEGAVQQGPVRARVLNDLSAEEKERYKADIRATNILLQGIPKDIYSLINHYTDAKDIWENVKMILEGSELTKDDRESQLYDEYMNTPMQLNSKFVNNMLPEWSRFITEVKLNRGLKESNSDQLYAYLKQHEENRIMMERFGQPNTDPLALVSDASTQQYPTQSSKSPNSTEPCPSDNFQMNSGSSSTENLIESLTNSLALLTQSYKSHLPQTNNQLRASSNARNQAMVQDGKVVVQDIRALWDYWKLGSDEIKPTDLEETDHGDEQEIRAYIVGNLLHYQDLEWYGALEDSELKEEALRNKAMMEGVIEDDDDESIDEREELCSKETHELPVCAMRRFEMIKYSFGDDEEYVAVKEDEYDDLTGMSKDAYRAYQEIFRMVDEGWMVTRAE
ncbi:hypothetical protein Tco_1027600 [Tanacetum coccineum]